MTMRGIEMNSNYIKIHQNTIKNKIWFSILLVLSVFNINGCSNNKKEVLLSAETNNAKEDLMIMNGQGNNSLIGYTGVLPMSYQELHDCAISISDIEEKEKMLKANDTKLEALKKQLENHSDEQDKKRQFIDSHNQKKIAEFNAQNDVIRSEMQKLNKEIDNRNTFYHLLAKNNDEYNAKCANRTFRKSDFNLLPMNLKKKMDRHSGETDIPTRE